MEQPPLERSSSLGAGAAVEFAECVYCFEPLPSVALCVLRASSGRRACRHLHHLQCMRRDVQYVRRHGGRDLRCALCNADYADVVELPVGDLEALFAAVAHGSGGLDAMDAKDLLRAMLWLDGGAVEELVDGPWQEAVGHTGVVDAGELQRLIRMAGNCAGRSVDHEPPLLIDDAAGWFDFWAAEALVLTRDRLVRALIKTFGTRDEDRDELRAAVGAVWGLFCGEAENINRSDFVSDDGMADALLAALAGSSVAAPLEAAVAAPPGYWSCAQCTLHNPDSAAACAACDAPAPARAAAQPRARHAHLTAGIRRQGTPRCYACGSGMSAGRVSSDAERSSRCAQCKRRPPVGAAVWLCHCGAAKCVRCATVETSSDAPSWMQRQPSHQAVAGAHDQWAASPAAHPPSLASERGANLSDSVSSEIAEVLPAPHDALELPSTALSDEGASPIEVTLAPNSSSQEEANASDPITSNDELPVECPHCRRRRAPAGTVLGRRSQWCQCIVEEQIEVSPAEERTLPSGLAEPSADREVVNCVNCRRPPQPEGWVGVNWRRWCQCNGSVGADLREHMRRRQRQRATEPLSADSVWLVNEETLRPEYLEELQRTAGPDD